MNPKYGFFLGTLEKCGVSVLNDYDTSRITCYEPSRSFKKLESFLRLQGGRINEFVEQLEYYFDIENNLLLSVQPMLTETTLLQSNYFFGQSNTLLKLLLRLEPIQSTIFKFLIQKLLSGIDETNNCDISSKIFNHIRWCELIYDSKLLLDMLLETIQMLSTQLQIEILAALPGLAIESYQENVVLHIQPIMDANPDLIPSVLECISNMCLPSDSQALNAAMAKAMQLLGTSPPPILPAITKFLLETTGMNNVEIVLGEIRSKLSEYLISIASLEDMENEISRGSSSRAESLNRIQSKERELMQSTQTLLVGVLKSVFQSRAILCTALFQSIEMEPLLSPIDLWLLFAIGDHAKYKSKVSTVLAKKWQEGALGQHGSQIAAAIQGRSSSLEALFPSMLAIAQMSLSSRKFGSFANQCRSFGGCLYVELYSEFHAAQYRQDIVASLVAHVASQSTKEVDASLQAFGMIADREFHQLFSSKLSSRRTDNRRGGVTLRNFSSFIKTLLEDVTVLSDSQQRILFRLIFQSTMMSSNSSSSSSSSSSTGNRMEQLPSEDVVPPPPDDVMILIKKYAGSMSIKLRKISIVGQVAYLAQADAMTIQSESSSTHRSSRSHSQSYDEENATATSDGGGGSLEDSNICKTLTSLLHRICDNESGRLRSFLMDELHAVIRSGKVKSQPLLSKLASSVEEELHMFLGGADEEVEEQSSSSSSSSVSRTVTTSSSSFSIPSEKSFDLNGSVSNIYIKILSTVLLATSFTCTDTGTTGTNHTTESPLDIRMLSPALALVGKCVKILENDSLSSLSVLLGAPLELPTREVMEKCLSSSASSGVRDRTRMAVCASLHFAVDWLREILNAFCISSSWEEDLLMPTPSLNNTRTNLLKRFITLVDLENELYEQVQSYPDYLEKISADYGIELSKNNKKMKGKTANTTNPATKKKSNKISNSGIINNEPTTLDFSINEISNYFQSILRPLGPHVCQLLGLGLLPRPLPYPSAATIPYSSSQSIQNEKSLASATASARLLSHSTKCALALQQIASSASSTIASTYSQNQGAREKASSHSSNDFYHFLVQLQSVGALRAIHYLLFRTGRALGSALTVNGAPRNPSLSAAANHVNSVDGSELLIDRPDLLLNDLMDESLEEDPEELLALLSHPIGLLTSIFSCQSLIDELTQWESQINAANHSDDDEEEEDQEEDSFIPPEESMDKSTKNTNIANKGTADSRPLLLLILFDLSGIKSSSLCASSSSSSSVGKDRIHSRNGRSGGRDSRSGLADRAAVTYAEITKALANLFEMCLDLTKRLHEPHLLDLAVTLVQFLDQLSVTVLTRQHAGYQTELPEEDALDCSGRLSSLCDSLLRIDWRDSLNHRRYGAKDVGLLVKMNLKWAADAVLRCQVLATEILPQILQEEDDEEGGNTAPVVSDYPTLTSVSFVYYYSPLFDALVDCWSAATRNDVTDDELCQHTVTCMSQIVMVFGALISFTKGYPNLDKSVIFRTALRGGRKFVEVFLKSYKVLHRLFSSSSEGQKKFLSILSSLQKSTRQLQVLCAHGKVMRDIGLAMEAPAIKKALEQLIYRMKSLVQENDCLGAFWVGNLKHRKLDGTEVVDEEDDEEEREKRTKRKRNSSNNNNSNKKNSKEGTKKTKRNKKQNVADTNSDDDKESEVDDDAHDGVNSDDNKGEDDDDDENRVDDIVNGIIDTPAVGGWTDEENGQEEDEDDDDDDNINAASCPSDSQSEEENARVIHNINNKASRKKSFKPPLPSRRTIASEDMEEEEEVEEEDLNITTGHIVNNKSRRRHSVIKDDDSEEEEDEQDDEESHKENVVANHSFKLVSAAAISKSQRSSSVISLSQSQKKRFQVPKKRISQTSLKEKEMSQNSEEEF